jgi:hypothetical protein
VPWRSLWRETRAEISHHSAAFVNLVTFALSVPAAIVNRHVRAGACSTLLGTTSTHLAMIAGHVCASTRDRHSSSRECPCRGEGGTDPTGLRFSAACHRRLICAGSRHTRAPVGASPP